VRLRARYALEGYDAGDSPFLVGMEDRKASLWLGGAAIWKTACGIEDSALLERTGQATARIGYLYRF